MKNIIDLTGKHILVTGASRGIGKAVCKLLDELGAKLLLMARNTEKLQELVSELNEPEKHKILSIDLSDIGSIEKTIDSYIKENGKLDGLVHSAGIGTARPIKNTTYDMLHGMMCINFYAFVELVRVYSKKKNNNGGSVVVMSSVAAKKGDKTKTAYCASKAAVEGAMRAMAVELADKSIRVNAVEAGFVKTEMFEGYLRHNGEENLQKYVLDKQYLGMGETDDIANAIAYLLSDAAKFITGSCMSVDGGFLS